MYLYPKIYEFIKIRNKFVEKIWALLCVSFAAQIATSPLSLYYFNQFPNYFLVSNIIVVPLASLIVYGGIALITFSFIPVVSDIIAIVLTYMLKILNLTVYSIEHLPYSTSVIVINSMQMGLLYLFLIILFYFFESKRAFLLKGALIIFLFTVLLFSINSIRNMYSKEITFYVQDKGTAIDIRSGKNVVFITDDHILENPAMLDFFIKGNRTKNGVRHIVTVSLTDVPQKDTLIGKDICLYHNFIAFRGNRFVLLNKSHIFPSDKGILCDYIYISHKANRKNTDFIKTSEVKKLILGSGMPLYRKTELHKEFPSVKGYLLYDLKKRGAFTFTPL
ncbi:MAG: Competence protein [Bacteroidetes bacterium ADurb.Bin408]|nr:MAG: Competence protein [Bacteroidetes bacterium ADurb.Bin408]